MPMTIYQKVDGCEKCDSIDFICTKATNIGLKLKVFLTCKKCHTTCTRILSHS